MDVLFSIPPIDEQSRLQFLYDRLAASFRFGPAVVSLSRRRLTGGEIRYGQPHRISISAHLSPAELEDTLRHEAAHAWAFQLRGARVAHGPLFRDLARKLGAKRGHAPQTQALKEFRARRKVEYRCEGCGQRFRRFRAFRGARHCIACWRAGKPSRLKKVKSDQ